MMTIHLPEDLEGGILAAVRGGRFASLDGAMTEAANLLLRRLKQQPPADESAARPDGRRIWEVAEEIRRSIPAEEWAKLPVDGAEQHDHYNYGTPKRPPA